MLGDRAAQAALGIFSPAEPLTLSDVPCGGTHRYVTGDILVEIIEVLEY